MTELQHQECKETIMDKQTQLLEQHREVVERIRHGYQAIGIIIVMSIIIFSTIAVSALTHPDQGLVQAFATLLMCWLAPCCVLNTVRQIVLLKEIATALNHEIKSAG
jgi:hypothetical protein